MLKQSIFILGLFCLLSCNDKLHTDQIDRNKFCSYFDIKTKNYIEKGKTGRTASPRINKVTNDKVSNFINKHPHRFDYILFKTFSSLINTDRNFDSSHVNYNFCKAISSDTFYRQFIFLTSGDRNKNISPLNFSVPELMKIASRFFMCDNIRPKDTVISYRICVGINGISELLTTRDYTVLEAFCFEAIFKNLHKRPGFIDNFSEYIKTSSQRNKQHFTDFPTHLANVREEGYSKMEKDKDLQVFLLNYYKRNIDNISFRIEL